MNKLINKTVTKPNVKARRRSTSSNDSDKDETRCPQQQGMDTPDDARIKSGFKMPKRPVKHRKTGDTPKTELTNRFECFSDTMSVEDERETDDAERDGCNKI